MTTAFSFNQAEAGRMRRAAFLPAVLIVPLATMYGLDSSKSQPTHFLITFVIGLVCAAVVVAISRSAVSRRIDELSRTTVEVGDGKLVWKSGMGETGVDLATVAGMVVRKKSNSVQAIALTLDNGRSLELQGYEHMDDLLVRLRVYVPDDVIEFKKWFQF